MPMLTTGKPALHRVRSSAALEQMMRRSIETGLCEPWQPLTWMDFVVLEMDNTIGLEVLFATAIFSHKVKSLTTFHTLEPIPFVNKFVSNAG